MFAYSEQYLSCKPGTFHCLVHDEQTAGLFHGFDNRVDIQRYQRPQVDDLCTDAFIGKVIGCSQGIVDLERVRSRW